MQLLHTSHGDIVFETIVSGCGSIAIGELEGGGFARADGNPVLDPREFDILPAAMRERALRWWEHREDETDTTETRALVFQGHDLLYADTWEPVQDVADILRAFPESSPFQQAALHWWGQKHYAAQARAQQQTQGYGQETGLLSEPVVPQEERPRVADLADQHATATYGETTAPPRDARGHFTPKPGTPPGPKRSHKARSHRSRGRAKVA